MLPLTRQARSAWKTRFVCTSCRALFAGGPSRQPRAVARVYAARHYSSPPDQHPSPLQSPPLPGLSQPPPPPQQQQQQTAETAKKPKQSKPSKSRRKQKAQQQEASSDLALTPSPILTYELLQENLAVLKEVRAIHRELFHETDTSDSSSGGNPEEFFSSLPLDNEQKLNGALALLKKALRRELRTNPQLAEQAAEDVPMYQLRREALGVLTEIKTVYRQWMRKIRTFDSSSGRDDGGENGSSLLFDNMEKLNGTLALLKRGLGPGLQANAQLAEPTAEDTPREKAQATPSNEAGIVTTKRQETLAEAESAAEKPVEKQTKNSTQEPAKPAEEPPAKAPSKTPKSTSKSKAATSSKKKKAKETTEFVVNRIDAAKIELTPIEREQPPVPRLAYGLDRVLFNPGVYHIRDPRSRVFNFDPYLERIMPIKEFDFDALRQYVTSSKDMTLIGIAAEHQKKYTGSTSSMTSTLAHFHYLLSAWRPINPCMLSKDFEIDSYRFTRIMRAPAATFLHWKDGTYAIDADKEFDTANILSMLGKSMEKFLTLPKQEFEKYRRKNSDQLTEEDRNGPESYHYTTLGDFLMRSQLDAHDPRLPGTGMFDLKTRAVISIRMDAQDFHKGMGYEIRTRFGNWESFEREYFDMIRSAFLKYSLQVRMGRMDGIFVAYHNTERIFGFQYIPLQEMDLSLHGQEDTTLGDREFRLSVYLLNKVLDKVTEKFPGRSLRLHFETRGEDSTPFMYIFAKPVTPDEIEAIQGATRAKVEEFERRMMGVVEEARALKEQESGEESLDDVEEDDMDEIDGEEAVTNSAAWEDLMLKVENELEDEEHGVTFVREAIEDALQESGLLRNVTSDETQRYVDAFLEALTGNGRRAASSGEAEPAVEGSEGSGATPSSVPEATEQIEQSSEEADEDDAQPSAAKDSSAEEPTLKDLIIKLATQIRAAPSQQRAYLPKEGEDIINEDEPEYALKLRKIERLLTELTEQPHQVDKAGEEGAGSGIVETGEVIAEDGQQVRQVEPAEPGASAGPTLPEHSEAEGETTEPPATPPEESATALSVDSTAKDGGEPNAAAEASDKAEFSPEESGDTNELYGLILTVRNKVDNRYVTRPEKLDPRQRWQVEYAIEEVNAERAQNLYKMVLKRRKKLLYPDDATDPKRWSGLFEGRLEKYSALGRQFRRREDRLLRGQPVYVYGQDEPLPFESVYGEAALDESGNGNEGEEEYIDEEENETRKGRKKKGRNGKETKEEKRKRREAKREEKKRRRLIRKELEMEGEIEEEEDEV
ncbi:hypothetical protein VTH06DRAFT_1254 [Thermothelomyces fergusii]